MQNIAIKTILTQMYFSTVLRKIAFSLNFITIRHPSPPPLTLKILNILKTMKKFLL